MFMLSCNCAGAGQSNHQQIPLPSSEKLVNDRADKLTTKKSKKRKSTQGTCADCEPAASIQRACLHALTVDAGNMIDKASLYNNSISKCYGRGKALP